MIPRKPGVYIFKNKSGQVIYVGKAIDLYHRVASSSLRVGSSVAFVETIIVESELEALILEANLIKRYLPVFNVRLTDDKDYLYIGITKEPFSKVITVRKKDLAHVKKFFGPFPSAGTVRDTLKLLRKVFPWCAGSKYGKACFYYHLNLCPGVCVGLISRQDYNKIISRFCQFMNGKKEELVKELTQEMEQASKERRFEEAQKIKRILEGIFYLTQTNRVSKYLENPNFLQDETRQALARLQRDLNLPNLPERIEGYDISNIQGKDAAGSMVVLINGEVDKSQYRRFKIRMAGKANDVGQMREMIDRRLKHLEWPLPDLILVDGGRAQARAVKFEIPVFGLAKRQEWLYPPQGEIIKLPKRSLSLRLLQKLRDESHRFAINYHRKLHGKMVPGL